MNPAHLCVLSPQKMGAARKLDELIAQHNGFLDKCLKECMLRDAVLPGAPPSSYELP